MISKLLTLYDKLIIEYDLASEANDESRTQKLNDGVTVIWEQILSYNPQNIDEQKQLSEFLLNQSLHNLNHRGDNQRINQKIVELHSYHPPD